MTIAIFVAVASIVPAIAAAFVGSSPVRSYHPTAGITRHSLATMLGLA